MGVNVSQWSNACNVQKQKTNKRIIYEISTQIINERNVFGHGATVPEDESSH